MPHSVPPPTRVEQLPLTLLGEIISDLDALMFRAVPSRRFWTRPIIAGEFAAPALAGDEHGIPRVANAVIIDRTRPGSRIAYYAASEADMPTTDREILAFMRRWGMAI